MPGQKPLHRVWLPVLLLLLGMWLRASLPWADMPFDVDEALYASFARQISHENNSLLLGQPVDKPPLSFYITALSFKLFTNPSEWAARLPDFFASILSMATVYALAYRLYRDGATATLALLFLAFSPFDIAFAGTVFTDPQITLWILLACLAASGGRWSLAGVFSGLAFATKRSAIQFFPLVIILGLIYDSRRDLRKLLNYAVPLAIISAAPFLWGAARGPDSPDWWALGLINNTPGRLIRSDEIVPRLLTWLEYLSTGMGGPLLPTLLLATGMVLLFIAIRNYPRQQAAAADLALTLTITGYLLLYWLVAFNTYDRYLHTLIPLIGLLMARTLIVLTRWLHRGQTRAAALLAGGILLIAMGPGTLQARQGNSLLSEAQNRYNGIRETAEYLNHLPPGTIVYDHWLGWSLGWYTGQQRPRDMWLRITYYPTPESLAADAQRQPDPQPRYFVVPAWASGAPWLDTLESAGFRLQTAARPGNFTIYRMEPP